MSAKPPTQFKVSIKPVKTDSVYSCHYSDKTCSSIQNVRGGRNASQQELVRVSCFKNLEKRNKCSEAKKLADKIERLHRCFVKEIKLLEAKKNEDIANGEGVLEVLRDQVNSARYLETDKLSGCSSIDLESFNNSFVSLEAVKRDDWRKYAWIRSVLIFKFN